MKAQRLIAMANELLAFARDLELDQVGNVLAEGDCPAFFPSTSASRISAKTPVDLPVWLQHARQLHDSRRKRAAIFDSEELFGEPAWDILLDLFIASKERRQVSVTSACIGSGVPSTTALRWLTVLEGKGLIYRKQDRDDARRIYVALTTEGYTKMLNFFEQTGMPVYLVDKASPD